MYQMYEDNETWRSADDPKKGTKLPNSQNIGNNNSKNNPSLYSDSEKQTRTNKSGESDADQHY